MIKRSFISRLNISSLYLLLALLIISSPAKVLAQACYTTFSGQNNFIDAEFSSKLNFTLTYFAVQTFSSNNKIKTGGITSFWRYSTDTATTQRAITTLPGYTSFTTQGALSNSGRGTLTFTARERKIYFIYYKFQTERGDVITSTYKISIT